MDNIRKILSDKQLVGVHKHSNLTLEIIDVQPMPSGVMILARGWIGKRQLGFGKDRTVDIERFKVYNPPLKIIDDVAHTMSLVGKPSKKIIADKVGNTTSTFYPSLNGYINFDTGDTGKTWAYAHDAATGTSVTTAGGTIAVESGLIGGGWYYINRGFLYFDTSAIGSDTIDSAIFSLAASGKADADNDGTDYMNLYGATPASTTALVVADYDQAGTTAFAAAIDIGSIVTNTNYNNWTLNASGLAAINKTGVTTFSVREGHDAEDIAIEVGENYVNFYSVASDYDPKIVVVHTASSAIKTIDGLAKGSTKTVNGLPIASVKSYNGLV